MPGPVWAAQYETQLEACQAKLTEALEEVRGQ
jgi:hypothetical protein